MNFAVIKTGGKQYKVTANDLVKIEKLEAQPGDVVTFDQVLMLGDGDDVTVGAPLVEGASVAGHLVATKKQRTVLIVKKQRRQHYDRRNGHRQLLSTVRIGEILTGGASPSLAVDEKLRARAAASAAATTTESAPAAKTSARPAPKAAEAKKKAAPKADETTPAPDFKDDVTLIGGVGPAMAKKLAAAGVTSLTQIAAWSDDDVEKYDAELALHGRAARDEWVQQAADLVAGKPPRAKIDQEAADKAKK